MVKRRRGAWNAVLVTVLVLVVGGSAAQAHTWSGLTVSRDGAVRGDQYGSVGWSSVNGWHNGTSWTRQRASGYQHSVYARQTWSQYAPCGWYNGSPIWQYCGRGTYRGPNTDSTAYRSWGSNPERSSLNGNYYLRGAVCIDVRFAPDPCGSTGLLLSD